MHRIDHSEDCFKTNLNISIQKTLKMNPELEIRGMTLDRLNLTIAGQVRSIGIKLSGGSNILSLINQINFRNNEINSNPSSIKYSNNSNEFNIKLEVNGKQNHETATFWLLDNFIYSIISSVDICSLIVGTLFDVPKRELYPDIVRDYLNNNQNRKISRLFKKHMPPLSNPNHLQMGRIIWNNAKHDGLHEILKVSHNSPDLETRWDAHIKPVPNSTLSQDEREIGKFCDNLLEESILFIDSVYDHLGHRLLRERLPLQI
ncbi:MAG: hypothetical protein ACTSX0_07990 [Promethearchaeota archaeon]